MEMQMTIQQADARYDEINRQLEELAAAWESPDHGDMTREEYTAQFDPLVRERDALARQYAAMRRADVEAQKIRLAGVAGMFSQ
jgi:hypothetical protein